MEELIGHAKVLSLATNTDAHFYLSEPALKDQDREGKARTEGHLDMMPLMQVKLRLLGKCAQCLLSKGECGHVWGQGVSVQPDGASLQGGVEEEDEECEL